MENIAWMAWTLPTAIFFVLISLTLGVMTWLGVAYPEAVSSIALLEWLLRVRRTVPANGMDVKFGDRLLRWGQGASVLYGAFALAWPGLRTGEFLLAVNHRPFAAGEPLLAAFDNLAEKDVVLTVNTRADLSGARDVVARPMRSERRLRYVDWVRRNREYVTQKTGGKVGYIHLPDMGGNGLIAFDTWFYPQIDKQALVAYRQFERGICHAFAPV